VLSPFLFLIIIDFIMRKSMSYPVSGIKWKHDRLTDLDFADDIVLSSDARSSLQYTTSRLREHATKLGKRISCEKTSVGTEQLHPVTIEQQTLEYVDNFPNLGSYIFRIGDAEVETRARLGKAGSVYQRLRQVWTSNTINTFTTLHLYTSVEISAAIYDADTWKGTLKITHMLDVFHRRCLRTTLGFSWRDHVTNDELMKRAAMQDLSNIVKVRRLTLAEHILRLPLDRLASVAVQWAPDGGKRRKVRPSKTWRQTLQEDLQEMRVSWSGVRRVACVRSGRI